MSMIAGDTSLDMLFPSGCTFLGCKRKYGLKKARHNCLEIIIPSTVVAL
jgi:hypothetical protein